LTAALDDQLEQALGQDLDCLPKGDDIRTLVGEFREALIEVAG
jgi:hypothetical protein